MADKEFIFLNVTINVVAKDAKEAYSKLCQAISAQGDMEYSTDTYREACTEEVHSVSELYPK